MTVLVVSAPLVGHLLPLANALRDTGHVVLVAAGGDARDGGGLPLRDIAGDEQWSWPGPRRGRRRP